MLEKTCPHCGKKSFSSSDHPGWECPKCHADITELPGTVATVADLEGSKNGR